MNGYFDIPSDTRLAGPEPSRTPRPPKWDEYVDNATACIRIAEKTDNDDVQRERAIRRTYLNLAKLELEKAIEALA